MFKRLMFLVVLFGFCGVVLGQSGIRKVGSQSISMVAGDSTVRDTVDLMGVLGVIGIGGQVWLNASSYTTGGFGTSDTARIVVKSSIAGLTYTLDSTLCTSLPCTLTVNAFDDSLFLDHLFFDVYWADSISVGAGDTAVSRINWLLKVLRQ